ncbi:MAG: hypothetical protein EBV19_05710 [Flavobacteriia bacterium]|nr:hypothetical protein [Flavobacteriia bacterium]
MPRQTGRETARSDTRTAGLSQSEPYKTYKWEYGDRTSVTDLGRVWNGGGGRDSAANSQVGQYYGYAQRDGKQTANSWYDYWRAGSDVYGKFTQRLLDPVGDFGKPQYGKRSDLVIEKQKDGKGDLVDAPKPVSAEDLLKLQKLRAKYKGRVSMPVSGQSGSAEVAINVLPGSSGLNFT